MMIFNKVQIVDKEHYCTMYNVHDTSFDLN